MNISTISNISYDRPKAYSPAAGRPKPLDDDLATVSRSLEVSQTADEKPEEKPRINREESFGAYDYAKLYNPDQTFDLVGRDSDPLLPDVEGTLGKLRKDELLGQYQSLTGHTPYQTSDSRPVENFDM